MRIGPIVLVAAAGSALAFGAASALGSPATTVKVDQGPVGERIVARAAVVPSAGVRRVFAAADGRILRVLAREGETVESGQHLAELETGGQKRVLEAPERGVVVARNCEIGDYAFAVERGQGRPLFELADPTHTELRVEVEESDAARLAADMPVTITARGHNEARVPGHVVRVSARLEQRSIGADDARVRADGLVRVAGVAFRGKSPDWPLGTRAEAIIEVRRRDAAARVPRAALSIREGRSVVDRPQLFWTREVPVEIISADDSYAEIRGLAPGTEVVVAPEHVD